MAIYFAILHVLLFQENELSRLVILQIVHLIMSGELIEAISSLFRLLSHSSNRSQAIHRSPCGWKVLGWHRLPWIRLMWWNLQSGAANSRRIWWCCHVPHVAINAKVEESRPWSQPFKLGIKAVSSPFSKVFLRGFSQPPPPRDCGGNEGISRPYIDTTPSHKRTVVITDVNEFNCLQATRAWLSYYRVRVKLK